MFSTSVPDLGHLLCHRRQRPALVTCPEEGDQMPSTRKGLQAIKAQRLRGHLEPRPRWGLQGGAVVWVGEIPGWLHREAQCCPASFWGSSLS